MCTWYDSNVYKWINLIQQKRLNSVFEFRVQVDIFCFKKSFNFYFLLEKITFLRQCRGLLITIPSISKWLCWTTFNVFSVVTFLILPSSHIVLHCNGVSRIIKIIEWKFQNVMIYLYSSFTCCITISKS